MADIETQDLTGYADDGVFLATKDGALRWFKPGDAALKFDASKAHHVNRGYAYAHATDYGDFYYEALVKPLGVGYDVSVGAGGTHLILFGFAGDATNGYTLTGNIRDENVATTYSIATTHNKLRHGEWAHVAMWAEGTKLGLSINGVPCAITACSGTRRVANASDCVWFEGGSDHNNATYIKKTTRLWEEGHGGIPYTNIHQTAVRPAIEHITLAHLSGATAAIIGNYGEQSLMDYGNGLQGSRHNGFLSESLSNGSAGFPYVYNFTAGTNRSPADLPIWIIDPFEYTGTAATKTQLAGTRIFADFSGADVHYGNSATLGLGTCRIGGNAWTGANYGKLNGYAFAASTSPGAATITDTSANGSVIWVKPSAAIPTSPSLAAAYLFYFRYTDADNCSWLQIDEYGSGYWIHRVSGSQTTAGSFTFGTTWTECKVVMSGSSVAAHKDGSAIGGGGSITMTQNQSATGKGFATNNPILHLEKFGVI